MRSSVPVCREQPKPAKWPREESNLRTRIRSPPLYPLSYGALDECSPACGSGLGRGRELYLGGSPGAAPARSASALTSAPSRSASAESQSHVSMMITPGERAPRLVVGAEEAHVDGEEAGREEPDDDRDDGARGEEASSARRLDVRGPGRGSRRTPRAARGRGSATGASTRASRTRPRASSAPPSQSLSAGPSTSRPNESAKARRRHASMRERREPLPGEAPRLLAVVHAVQPAHERVHGARRRPEREQEADDDQNARRRSGSRWPG